MIKNEVACKRERERMNNAMRSETRHERNAHTCTLTDSLALTSQIVHIVLDQVSGTRIPIGTGYATVVEHDSLVL